MRTAIFAACLALALAAQPKPSDVYAAAIAEYAAGADEAAFDSLHTLAPRDSQDLLKASEKGVLTNGGSAASRRHLEVIAMLHTEYALFGPFDKRDVGFHVDMAHLRSLFNDRSSPGAPIC